MTKKTRKKEDEIKPMMTSFAASPYTTVDQSTRQRRNVGGQIERTNRFENIDNGLVPYKYSKGVNNKSSLDVRDVVILCQKAYYNFLSLILYLLILYHKLRFHNLLEGCSLKILQKPKL